MQPPASADDECGQPELLNSNVYYKITSRCVRHLMRMTRVDFEPEPPGANFWTRFIWVRRYGLASNIIFSIASLSMVHLSCVLYNQYSLEFSLTRLKELHRDFGGSSSIELRPAMAQEIYQLDQSVAQKRQLLSTLGASNQGLNFAIQCIYLNTIIMVFMSYFAPSVYFKWLTLWNQYFALLLIDYKQELNNCRESILGQIETYMNSSRIHTRHLYWALNRLERRKSSSDQERDAPPQIRKRRELDAELHLKNCIEFDLANRMNLVPFDRETEWVLSWVIYYLLAVATCALLAVGYDSYVALFLFRYSPNGQSTFTSNPLHFLLEHQDVCNVLLLLLTINIATTTHGTIFSATCIDQTVLANELNRRMRTFLDSSNRKFHRLLILDETKATGLADALHSSLSHSERYQANSELLYLLMHYKLFIVQSKPLRHRFGHTLLTCMCLLFSMPIVNRFHLSMLEARMEPKFKVFITTLSLFVSVPASLMLFPACHMHSRCLRLSKTLNGLLAHVIFVHGQPQWRAFYEDHLVCALRREVINGHNSKRTDNFAIKFSELRFDYATVVEFYFWFGILVISIMFQGSSSDSKNQTIPL